MSDDKTNVGPDRSKVAGELDYEVNFVIQSGISSAEARKIIERFGNDREKQLPRPSSRVAKFRPRCQGQPA